MIIALNKEAYGADDLPDFKIGKLAECTVPPFDFDLVFLELARKVFEVRN